MQLDRQERVKHPDQVKEELICEFCADIAVDPVQCLGKCQSTYCRKCATEWCQARRADATCPKKCMKKWKFRLIPKRPMEMICPYSEECVVGYAEDLQRHVVECPHQPIQELLKHCRKTQFMCDRDHKLEFMEKLPQEMTDPICMECSSTENVKSLCHFCGTMYCNKCRIPEYTQRGCPANHVYKIGKEENIRCSICGLEAAYVNLPTYQDTQCKFNICELCFRKIPRASQAQMKLCKTGHNYMKLPTLIDKMCIECNKTVPCWKECIRCGEFVCLRCERGEFRLTEESDPAELLFERKECQDCKSVSNVNFFDKENRLLLCYICAGKPRKKAPIFCDQHHKLAYAGHIFIRDLCNCCNQLKRCRLLCKECKPEAKFCSRCKPADLRKSCYLGHPYERNRTSLLRECIVCGQYKQTQDCTICNFNICQSCSQGEISKPAPTVETSQFRPQSEKSFYFKAFESPILPTTPKRLPEPQLLSRTTSRFELPPVAPQELLFAPLSMEPRRPSVPEPLRFEDIVRPVVPAPQPSLLSFERRESIQGLRFEDLVRPNPRPSPAPENIDLL